MMLPDRKTLLALGPYLPCLKAYYDCRRGPVANGGAVNDLSGNGNDLTNSATAAWTPAVGLQATGAQYSERDFGLVHTYPFTVRVVMRSTDVTQWQTGLCLADRTVDTKYTQIGISSSQFRYQNRDGGTGVLWTAAFSVSNDTWYDFVLVATNATTTSLFCNGLLWTYTALNFGTLHTPNRISVGRIGRNSAAAYLRGNVAISQYFDTALPAANIRALYESQRHLFGV